MSGTVPGEGRAMNKPDSGVGRLSVPLEGETSIGTGRRCVSGG